MGLLAPQTSCAGGRSRPSCRRPPRRDPPARSATPGDALARSAAEGVRSPHGPRPPRLGPHIRTATAPGGHRGRGCRVGRPCHSRRAGGLPRRGCIALARMRAPGARPSRRRERREREEIGEANAAARERVRVRARIYSVWEKTSAPLISKLNVPKYFCYRGHAEAALWPDVLLSLNVSMPPCLCGGSKDLHRSDGRV
jgi:hypothetical protein